MMFDGIIKFGDVLFLVWQVVVEYQFNFIIVLCVYQELVDEGLVEKCCGLGMFMIEEVVMQLCSSECDCFFNEEWLLVFECIQCLGLNFDDLLFQGKFL